MEYNGSGMIAMIGDKCVTIAADTKYGQQYECRSHNFQKVFKIQDNILMGLAGLATDVQTL